MAISIEQRNRARVAFASVCATAMVLVALVCILSSSTAPGARQGPISGESLRGVLMSVIVRVQDPTLSCWRAPLHVVLGELGYR